MSLPEMCPLYFREILIHPVTINAHAAPPGCIRWYRTSEATAVDLKSINCLNLLMLFTDLRYHWLTWKHQITRVASASSDIPGFLSGFPACKLQCGEPVHWLKAITGELFAWVSLLPGHAAGRTLFTYFPRVLEAEAAQIEGRGLFGLFKCPMMRNGG